MTTRAISDAQAAHDAAAVRATAGAANPVPLRQVERDPQVRAAADALLATLLTPPGPGGRGRSPAGAAAPGRSGGRGRVGLVRTGVLAGVGAVVVLALLVAGVVGLPWNHTAPAAGAYAATPAPLTYTPLPGSAKQVLESIAERTAALPDDTGSGNYARVETQEWNLFTRVGGDDHTVTSVVMPQRITRWIGRDGSGRTLVRYDQPGIPWTTTDEQSYAPGSSISPWPTLSPDDDELAEQLALGHPASNGPAERLVAIDDLLRDQPMDPDVRAAVLRYLAATPTLELAGATTDRLGRRGVAVALESDFGGLPVRYTMIVDPDDGRVLASEQMLTTTAGALNVAVPSVISYTAYANATYTTTTED